MDIFNRFSIEAARRLLQAHAERGPAPIALPRLTKMLGESASTVMRTIIPLTDAEVGGQAGPGWVRMQAQDGRWLVALTDEGAKAVQQVLAASRD